MNKKHTRIIALIIVLALSIFSLVLIKGTDTNWGKTEVTKLTLSSADGDEISAMLYKPNTASPESPAPCAMILHGGNDMLEQTGTYALELARRGYVVVTWDYSGCHNSDIPTGPSETAPTELSGWAVMGTNTIWNTVKSFSFVDMEKIITMGHSMGGIYTISFALEHQEEVFMQVNLGMNLFGNPDNQKHDFNIVAVFGDSDESILARSNNDVMNMFNSEQIRRIFTGDYDSAIESVPMIEIGKVYEVEGTDGGTYTRTGYMPNSCHAYYLVNSEAIKTVIYSITSQTGVGLDEGVNSPNDINKVGTVWFIKDFAFILMLACVVAMMFVAASMLFETETFKSLMLKETKSVSLKKKSVAWYISIAVLFLLPVLLYRVGILSSSKFLGIDISKVWLLGGTNNTYISWQWMVALGMLILFLVYHFAYGKKNGGNLVSYGFATSDDGKFKIGYILKAFLFGLITVGCGYLVFALISAYTKQGLHIATFMMSVINTNRTFAVLMYFIFLIPYFLISSLAFKAVGISDKENSVAKTTVLGAVITVGGIFLLWLVFIMVLNFGNTLTSLNYFMKDRFYIYSIAILPLVIGMSIANALNIFVSKKTNSVWAGLFTALLWGAWMIVCCGGIAKYFY